MRTTLVESDTRLKAGTVGDVWAVLKRRQLSLPDEASGPEETESTDHATMDWLEERLRPLVE